MISGSRKGGKALLRKFELYTLSWRYQTLNMRCHQAGTE